jgi:hypothetical protein
MDWIKKNLILVLSGLATLAAIGAAGFFFYTRLTAEQEVDTQLTTLRETLNQLQTKVPFPSDDNVQAAKEQEKELLAFKAKAERFFKPEAAPQIKNDADFGYLLLTTLARLHKTAQADAVTLPTNFYFGFTVQKDLLQYDTTTMNMVCAQLSDIDALCQILFRARIYELMGVKRAAVSTNDTAAMENTAQDLPIKDYLTNRKITTNQTVRAVISPYELTFKCASPELAATLEGMERAPYGFLVKYLKVEPADSISEEPGAQESGRTTYTSRYGNMSAADMKRYGFAGRRPMMGRPPSMPTPTTAAPDTTAAAAVPKKPGTVLKEKPLRVSMYIEVVKLLPPSATPAGQRSPAPTAAPATGPAVAPAIPTLTN